MPAGGEGELLDSAPLLDIWGAAGSRRKQPGKPVIDLVTSSSSEQGNCPCIALSSLRSTIVVRRQCLVAGCIVLTSRMSLYQVSLYQEVVAHVLAQVRRPQLKALKASLSFKTVEAFRVESTS